MNFSDQGQSGGTGGGAGEVPVWGGSIQRPERGERGRGGGGRERRSLAWRGGHEQILLARRYQELAQYLDPEDASLIQAVHRDGVSFADVARLSGRDRRMVARRVQVLTERLMSPAFSYVLLRLSTMEPEEAKVAEWCVLRGRSLRVAALELGMSIHLVRKHRDSVLSGIAAISNLNPPTSEAARWRETRVDG